ncbi:hypothetical protein [Pedococcus sp. 5OH_020]|uniref:hypothetical protein n=1 Tax=Pedococcus sp. 5OH_020 TaxID=2989814 RepID=UPI0022E9B38E|nr:hypothetical protein [Pedococcus sp. 5OH_020]
MSTPPSPRRGIGGSPEEPDPTGIRALLSSLPDPGPMPPDLVERITASIAAEQSARQAQGTVTPLRSRRRWGWQQVAAVAAAAAAVAIGLPAVLRGTGVDVVAAFSSDRAESAAGGGSATGQALVPSSGASATASLDSRASAPHGRVVLQDSGTAYSAGTLASQVRDVLTGPPSPGRTQTGASAWPAEQEQGLRSCLDALGVAAWMPVSADRATYRGRRAVVALVQGDTGQSIWVVDPGCTAQHPAALAGPVPLG